MDELPGKPTAYPPQDSWHFTIALDAGDISFLLRRDGQYSSDAPWIPAFGEDDEVCVRG